AAQPVTEVAKHETGAAATATEVAQPAGDVESQASEVAPVEAAAPGVGEVAPRAADESAGAPSAEKLPFDEPAFAESSVAPSAEAFAPAVEAEAGEPAAARAPVESHDDESSVLDLSHAESPVAQSRAEQAAERGEAVYTFDEVESAAWSARGEEAGEAAATPRQRGTGGLESRPSVEGFERPTEAEQHVYAAPEFAAAPVESAAEEWLDLGVEEQHLSPPAGGAGESRAASQEGRAGGSAPFAFEPTAEVETPQPRPGGAETAPPAAPAPPTAAAHDRASSGFASHVEDTGTGLSLADKGIELSGVEPEDVSIIPKAIQLRLASDDAAERAASVRALAHLDTGEAFQQICVAFDDPAQEVRNAAARALYDLSADRAESFTRALRESPPERRRQIGASLASSGLADEAVSQLTGESRERTYDAFSLLFLMAKAGETAPLIRAVESHADSDVRLAVVKLLALSGQQEVLPSFRRLAVRGSLPTEVRAAVMEAIYQISSAGQPPAPKPTRTVQ
ncbi:MAG: HEAT repeat domain-containing protein, partial [Pyrinomonadaceae bacterium]